MYTPKLYSKGIVYRYSYYYDYYTPEKIMEDYRTKERSSTERGYFDALNSLFENKGYARERNEWFNDNVTYKTERVTSRYNYELEGDVLESVIVLHFTMIHRRKDNVSYEILFHLPYYIKTGDKEIYLPELIEGVLSDIEKEMSSIISRESPEGE